MESGSTGIIQSSSDKNPKLEFQVSDFIVTQRLLVFQQEDAVYQKYVIDNAEFDSAYQDLLADKF